MATIRDFIYIDVERLNSLYSQVFEGVVNTIVQTELNEEEGTNTQRGGLNFSGSSLEERVAAASYKTESKLLYDHMYNSLEQKLQTAIVEIESVNRDSIDDIEHSFMVKVRGAAEIWDYDRIKLIFDRYNEIGLALSYITKFSQRGILESLQEQIGEAIKSAKSRQRKVEVEELQKKLNEIKKQLDPVEQAKNSNLYFDGDYMKHLSLITSLFYADGIEVVIHPHQLSEDVLFRAVLDRQWLRISPEHLRALYAGRHAKNWVIVGQITYVPVSHQDTPTVAETVTADATTEQPGAMRDAYRNLVSAYYGLESTFSDSKKLVEVIIHPLAIYRETIIPEAEIEQ